LNTVLSLVRNDLKRDWKRPWSMLLLAAMPMAIATLIAAVFGGSGKSAAMPTVHVVLMDEDKDMLSDFLRSMPAQGDSANKLQLQFVTNREDGIELLEQNKASAFVILPTNMTLNLLNGQTNAIELYENPAQQILPKVVRQGISLLAVGLSGVAELLSGPLKSIRELRHIDDFPTDESTVRVALDSVRNLRHVRTYLFPPLIQFTNVAANDYQLTVTNSPAPAKTP